MENINWRYCPGPDKPADFLTRGVSASKLTQECNRWLCGPSWLLSERNEWPNNDLFDEDPDITSVLSCYVELNTSVENKSQPVFPLDRYSGYGKQLRITALIYRFVNNALKKGDKLTGKLALGEIEKAEIYWIRYIQQTDFSQEISVLKKNGELPRKSSILKLTPFLDKNDILRVRGRLQEATIPYDEKHPIILPKKSELTEKIVWRAHEESMHSGTNATLTRIRRRFWIIQGRQRVKKIIAKCVICKRFKGKPGSEPFAPLPRDRINIAQPFSVTGIDFAGPLYVRSSSEERSKTYIMLFTCATIRAVHLELVENLWTESCILGLRRFISRRGVPKIIYSDNAKTFKRTALELEELAKLLKEDSIQELAREKRIQWKFSVERGSWWGGFWERLVRTVKGCLKSTLGRRLVDFQELQTILSEVEATVNSRPLTYIDDDPTNLFILSPAKFLIGESDIGFSPSFKLPNVDRNEIVQTWKMREAVTSKYWKKWQQEYLQQLRSAHTLNSSKSSNLKEGEVVILHDQDRPRLLWKLVRITQTFQGRDGKTRACEVVTSDGTKLRRPVQLLYPLEVRSFGPGEDVENNEL